uniref:Vacuolar fusion protein MON1 homolog n=2 Tax=Clastoptera arizonana TaxID=38151 RepID=A0A1B6DQG5_9HEMI
MAESTEEPNIDLQESESNNDNLNIKLSNNIEKLDLLDLKADYIDEESPPREEDCINSKDWKEKKKHIFILSSAGKPVYSRYGSEERLVTIFGVMQALVSFIQDSQDVIRSIHAGNLIFVFLLKGPIIVVSVSRTGESEEQLRLQLT